MQQQQEEEEEGEGGLNEALVVGVQPQKRHRRKALTAGVHLQKRHRRRHSASASAVIGT
jgi:hypothetical protein